MLPLVKVCKYNQENVLKELDFKMYLMQKSI